MDDETRKKLDAWAALSNKSAQSAKTKVAAALQAPDRSLRQIAAIAGVTGVLKGGDSALTAYLCQRSTVDAAIAILLRDSDAASRRQHATQCRQLLALLTACQSAVSEAMCTARVLDALLAPLRGTPSPFVLAVLGKTYCLLWDVEPHRMQQHFIAEQTVLAAIVRQLTFSSAFEMLGKVVRVAVYRSVDADHDSDALWSALDALPLAVYDLLHPRHDSRLHEGAVSAVAVFAAAASDSLHREWSDCLLAWMTRAWLSDSALTRLMSFAFAKGTAQNVLSSRLGALRIIQALLPLAAAADAGTEQNGGGRSTPVLRAVLSRFGALCAIVSDVQAACAESQSPPQGLRLYRYDLFQFIATLAELNNKDVFDAFAEHALSKQLLETFLNKQSNHFVVGCVLRVIGAILERPLASAACVDMMSRARLLSRLVLADQAHRQSKAPAAQPGAARLLVHGGRHAEHGAFLANLFQLINQNAANNVSVGKAVQGNSVFRQYARLTGQRDDSPLGGIKPDKSSGNVPSPFDAINKTAVFWNDGRNFDALAHPTSAHTDALVRSSSIGTEQAHFAVSSKRADSLMRAASMPVVHHERVVLAEQAPPLPAPLSPPHDRHTVLVTVADLLMRAADANDDPVVDGSAVHTQFHALFKPLIDERDERLLPTFVKSATGMFRRAEDKSDANSITMSSLGVTAAQYRRKRVDIDVFANELLDCVTETEFDADVSSQPLVSRASVHHMMRICGLTPQHHLAINELFDKADSDNDERLSHSQFVAIAANLLSLRDKKTKRKKSVGKTEMQLEAERIAMALEAERIQVELEQIKVEKELADLALQKRKIEKKMKKKKKH